MSVLPALKVIKCGVGKTKQKIGVEHDINKIIARYKKTGDIPLSTDVEGKYVDVSQIGDFQDCQNRIVAANDMFYQYPSQLRRRFNNDVKMFVDYVMNINDGNIQEAICLGLVKKPEPKPEPKDTTVNKDDKAGDK